MFRLNYGNGQVHGTWDTRTEAERECTAQRDWSARHNDPSYPIRIERKDFETGDWYTVRDKEPS